MFALSCLDSRADSAWDNWPGGNPFQEKANPGQSAPAGGASNGGTSPAGSGPLSLGAADRYRQAENDLNSRRSAAETEAAGAQSCLASNCSASSRIAQSALNSSRKLSAAAREGIEREQAARKRILDAIKSGTGKNFAAGEVGNFNRLFEKNWLPSEADIHQLHPKLQDPAFALRTSRAIENMFRQTQLDASRLELASNSFGSKNQMVAAKAGSVGNTSLLLSDLKRSDNRRAPASVAGNPAQQEPKMLLARQESENIFQNSSLPSLPALPSLSASIKKQKRPGSTAELENDDTSFMAGIFHELRLDLSPQKDQALEPQAAAKISAMNQGKARGESHSEFSGEIKSILDSSLQKERPAQSQGLDGKGSTILAAQELDMKDVSLFERVHLRIKRYSF